MLEHRPMRDAPADVPAHAMLLKAMIGDLVVRFPSRA